jgi:hypothetical protein
MSLQDQIIWLFLLAIPVACIAWTVTHEEVFSEVHNYCLRRHEQSKSFVVKKFFYLFTCEYCFSHYVTIVALTLTGYKLLMDDWRGYVLAGFAVVWVANIYMSLYSFLRTDIKKEKIITKNEEEKGGRGV